MRYTIILSRQEEGGFTAQCLEVPGAISQGETREEAIRNAKEALELVLDVLKEEASQKGKEIVKVSVGV